MAKRPLIGILTAFLFTAFFLPAVIPLPTNNNIPIQQFIVLFLIIRIILVILPVYLGLSGVPVDRKSLGWSDFGWCEIFIAVGLAAATLLMGLFFPAGETETVIRDLFPRQLFLFLLLAVVSAAAEEIFFRSWLNGVLPFLGMDSRISAILSIGLFALIHIGNGPRSVVFAALAGTLYTGVYLFRRNIWSLLLAHILHNTAAFALHSFG